MRTKLTASRSLKPEDLLSSKYIDLYYPPELLAKQKRCAKLTKAEAKFCTDNAIPAISFKRIRSAFFDGGLLGILQHIKKRRFGLAKKNLIILHFRKFPFH